MWGQLGEGHRKRTEGLRKVTLPEKVTQIACGSFHTLALDESGNVWVWGSDDFGQLGVGGQEQQLLEPMVNKNLTRVAKIYAGQNTSAFIDEKNEL